MSQKYASNQIYVEHIVSFEKRYFRKTKHMRCQSDKEKL